MSVPTDALHLDLMSAFSDLTKQRAQYHVNALLLLMLVCAPRPAASTGGAVKQGVVPETGLRYWEWQGEGALLRLTQRLPDQTRAFFMARGFAPEDADFLARKCVFQTLFRNTALPGGAAIAHDLEAWKIHAGETTHGLFTREQWNAIWEARGLAQPARIAFEWSLLPTRQVYQPADYNWGMTSFGLEPGTRFDLEFSWEREGSRYSGRFEEVECPADLHPEPQS